MRNEEYHIPQEYGVSTEERTSLAEELQRSDEYSMADSEYSVSSDDESRSANITSSDSAIQSPGKKQMRHSAASRASMQIFAMAAASVCVVATVSALSDGRFLPEIGQSVCAMVEQVNTPLVEPPSGMDLSDMISRWMENDVASNGADVDSVPGEENAVSDQQQNDSADTETGDHAPGETSTNHAADGSGQQSAGMSGSGHSGNGKPDDVRGNHTADGSIGSEQPNGNTSPDGVSESDTGVSNDGEDTDRAQGQDSPPSNSGDTLLDDVASDNAAGSDQNSDSGSNPDASDSAGETSGSGDSDGDSDSGDDSGNSGGGSDSDSDADGSGGSSGGDSGSSGGSGGTETHTHNYTSAVTKTATCKDAGVMTYTCSCGDTYTESIPATGHTEETLPSVAATCTTAGKTEGAKCSACGEILMAQEEIPATGHTEETIPAVAATCTTAGKSEGTKCSVCGEMLTAQEEIPAMGHSITAYTDNKDGTHSGICTVCSETVTEDHTVESYTTDGNNLTHSGICTANGCDATVTESHSISGGTCTAIGCSAAISLSISGKRQTTVNGTTSAIMVTVNYSAESADNLAAAVALDDTSDFTVFGPQISGSLIVFRLEAKDGVTSGSGSFTVSLTADGNEIAVLSDTFELVDTSSQIVQEQELEQPISEPKAAEEPAKTENDEMAAGSVLESATGEESELTDGENLPSEPTSEIAGEENPETDITEDACPEEDGWMGEDGSIQEDSQPEKDGETSENEKSEEDERLEESELGEDRPSEIAAVEENQDNHERESEREEA